MAPRVVDSELDGDLALAASGKAASINKPEPGQGLRLKPIVMNGADKHYFRPDPPEGVMSPWGSTFALTRGALAIAGIAAGSYVLKSWLLAPVALTTAYVALFHAYRSISRPPAGTVATHGSPTMRQRVCVIGGGLSGVVTLKELSAAGHDAVCFEGSSQVGGGFHGAYKSCYLTVSNHWMAFSDLPAEEEARVFWSAQQYIDYLKRYVEHFALGKQFRYSTYVESVDQEAAPSAPMGVQYRVTLVDAVTGAKRVETFDAVANCSGNNHSPKVPDFKGRDEFEASGGQVIHSANYHDASPFVGKRVVCVGAGESGADIVKEISEVAAQPCYLSLHRGVSVATKYPMRSAHTNDAFHARVHYYAHPTLNNWLFQDLNKKISTMDNIDPVFAMIGRLNLEAGGGSFQYITKNETFVEPLCNGKCVKKSGIARLTSKGVEFTDGSTVDCDVVLCNTGFKRDWSCLSGQLAQLDVSATRNLFKHMIHPATGPSLSFIGWARPAEGGVPAIAEMQARYLALLLSGQRTLPDNWQEQTRMDKKTDEERFFLTPRLESLVHYPKIMEELAELIGCKMNLFALFFTDHTLWRRLWFGAHQACVYRLQGPGASPKLARDTIDRLPVAWFTNERSTGMARKLFLMNVVSFVGTPFGVFDASW